MKILSFEVSKLRGIEIKLTYERLSLKTQLKIEFLWPCTGQKEVPKNFSELFCKQHFHNQHLAKMWFEKIISSSKKS